MLKLLSGKFYSNVAVSIQPRAHRAEEVGEWARGVGAAGRHVEMGVGTQNKAAASMVPFGPEH